MGGYALAVIAKDGRVRRNRVYPVSLREHPEGRLALSCMILTVDCDDNQITAIEGLSDPATGTLHPIQEAFTEDNGAHGGF